MYEWTFETPIYHVSEKSGVSDKPIINFYKQIRREITSFLGSTVLNLGGSGCIVQIDESKFMRLKHNRGQPSGTIRSKVWAFGIYDVATKKIVIKVVRNRKQQTLFPIITSYVLPHSTVWSDEFSVYTGGPNYPMNMQSPLALLGPYNHCTVNHSLWFKDPVTGVNTNAIEGSWSAAKRKFKAMNGTKRSELQSYVDEYVWRVNFCKERHIFFNLIDLIKIR